MRNCGVLLPVTGLPGPYGIGTLGKPARAFIDFLHRAGQTYWQVLPIGPTGYGDSPYQSFSAFAGNPYCIDLPTLVEDGLLTESELRRAGLSTGNDKVDYALQYEKRFALLEKASRRFDRTSPDYLAFLQQTEDWLPDYALFMALKAEQGQAALLDWPRALRMRAPSAISRAWVRLDGATDFWAFLQYTFYRQWQAMKAYAHGRGIRLVGDIPIYVSMDSSDLWANPELFQLDDDHRPVSVSGCPPDAFAAGGQLWGNPLYDWPRHSQTGYDWWLRRLRHAGSVFDVVRIDHFRGFAGYYSIPYGDKDARGGHWEQGPGMNFVGRVKAALPELQVIAEDLGYLTQDVRQLLADSGYPGMKVLQFAFDTREESDYMPYTYPRHCVVYTGTHDNTTCRDWQYSARPEDVALARAFLHPADEEDFAPACIRCALASVGDICIIPLADYLNLGAEGRINTPGTTGQNWVWRCPPKALTAALADSMARQAKLYGRSRAQGDIQAE